jgi:hypothetical protein
MRRRAVIAATGLVMLGGAGAAVAATQDSSGFNAQSYINDLAGRLNVTPSALSAAIKAADSDRINAAVAAGRLTQAQADRLQQRIDDSATGLPSFAARFGERVGDGIVGLRALVPVATQYLAISAATLRSDLAAGRTLAEIADSAGDGRSSAGLKAAITAAVTTQLNDAVSSGRITSAQESARLASLSSRLDALLASTFTAGGWARGGPGWSGRGGPHGGTGSTGPHGFGGWSGRGGGPFGPAGSTGTHGFRRWLRRGGPYGPTGSTGVSGASDLFGSAT